MSWGVNSYSRRFSYVGDAEGFIAYFQKKEDVASLIRSGQPEDIDRAGEIAKTIEVPIERCEYVLDVCAAYAKLKAPENYRKAYQLTLSISDQTDVKQCLQALEIGCLDLNHVEGSQLAEEIRQFSSTYDFAAINPVAAQMQEMYTSTRLTCSIS